MQIQYYFKAEGQSDADISIASYEEVGIPSTKKCNYCSANNADQILPTNIKAEILYWSYFWKDTKKVELINLTVKKIGKVYSDKFVCNNKTCKVRLSNDIRISFHLKGMEIR